MFSPKVVAATLATACVLSISPARGEQCNAARVLIVLDRSSSMVTGSVGGKTKWEVATSALSQVVNTYQGSIEFGLMVFPNPAECGPGAVKVSPALNRAAQINAELAVPPPAKGNWTPMAQSLDVAAQVQALNDTSRANHVLLITDGWQYCDPYEASTRFSPVVSVQNLKALGITTHIVGFGDSVDALTLNKMAESALTKVAPNCDIHGEDAAGTNNCYYQANDPNQLLTALQDITGQISGEVCDGKDNDCDGVIDDNLSGPPCGQQLGVCAGARMPCGGVAGWQVCSSTDYERHAQAQGQVYQPAETNCDGKDNDCDGTVDEGCASGCNDGETRPCGVDQGQCKPGTQVCNGGQWGACTGEVKGSQEVCDNVDNDCDGTVDGVGAFCANGGPCINGACQNPVEPIQTGGGCDCQLDHRGPQAGAGLLSLLLLGLALALRRRR